MTTLAWAISRALIHFAWQGAIVGFLLWIVLLALRRRSASSRYLAACAALAILAAMPLLTTWVLYTLTTEAATLAPTGSSELVSAGAAPTDVPAAGRLSQSQRWILPLWSLGVLLFSGRMMLGYRHAFRLRRLGTPAAESVNAMVRRLKIAMGVRARIRVLMSSMADSPSVVGWMRPVVLLPAATLMGLTPLQLEAILAHEIGHIKRYDYLVNLFQMLVETLLFYHPLVWWTSRTIRNERELCCDDLAVQFSGNTLRYARALATIEKHRLRSLTTPGVAMASTGGPLLHRIQRLAGVSAKEHGPSRLPIALAMGLGVLSLTLNTGWTQGQDARGVKVDLGSASVIHRTPVQYPEAAQKQKITGIVQLEVKLDSTGTVADARVLTGPEELRREALASILNWHFTSDAARSIRQVTISFSEEGTQVHVQEAQRSAEARLVAEQRAERAKLEAEAAQQIERRKAEVEAKRAELAQRVTEAKLDDLRAKLAFLLERGYTPQHPQILELRRAIAEFELNHNIGSQEAAKAAAIQAELQARRMVNGRHIGLALKEIRTPGLSEAVRNDLLARLPIRPGDVVSEESWRTTDRAIHEYDRHLRVQFLVLDDGQAALQVSAPSVR